MELRSTYTQSSFIVQTSTRSHFSRSIIYPLIALPLTESCKTQLHLEATSHAAGSMANDGECI